jgi:hypothetical protein
MPPTFTSPLRISPNGRYFVTGDGQPFFWMGDTAWPFFTRYPMQVALDYLAKRASQGFNVVQGVLAWSAGTGMEAATPGPNEDGQRPWEEDPAHPNPAFFDRVEKLLRAADKQGIVLAMLPTWGYYVMEARTFREASAYTYGKYLGERFRKHANLVWVSGGDRIPVGRESVYRALAQGLRAGDDGAHLITYHPCGWRHSSQYWQNEDWLDFNMIETWTAWPQVYAAVHSDFGLLPPKPVVLGEGAYEDGPEYPLGPITPLIVRRQAWWSFMAGGFVTYGQNNNWRDDVNWAEGWDRPGAGHMTLFKQIATSRPWTQMVPDQSLFNSGVSSERTLNTALRTLDSTCAMLYLSSQCHVSVNVDRILTRNVKVTLVNPATGEEKDAGTFPTSNAAGSVFPQPTHQWFSVPGYWEDAVLILDGVD